MTTIFVFSAMPADESQVQSGHFAWLLIGWLRPDYPTLSPDDQYTILHLYDHIVRKCAHATEYTLLGILVEIALDRSLSRRGQGGERSLRPSLIALCSVAICALYASSDEIHQLFVPGRAGMVGDVAIDTCGAFIGVLVTWIVIAAARRSRASRREMASRDESCGVDP